MAALHGTIDILIALYHRKVHGGRGQVIDVALNEAVAYLLEARPDRIAAHALALGDRLIDGLTRLELEVMSPRDPARRGASVSFAHARAAEIGPALAARNIHVWAGDGRVRASTHLYNDEADVNRYLEVVQEIAGGG